MISDDDRPPSTNAQHRSTPGDEQVAASAVPTLTQPPRLATWQDVLVGASVFLLLTERVEGERLVEFPNAYFSLIAPEIAATDGIIDRYIGDAVMAYWCRPSPRTTKWRCAAPRPPCSASPIRRRRIQEPVCLSRDQRRWPNA